MRTYNHVTCPHCRHLTYNNKSNCSNCGLLLLKDSDCLCDYCKRPIRKYESLLKSALMAWYVNECKFPIDEAKHYMREVFNALEADK